LPQVSKIKKKKKKKIKINRNLPQLPPNLSLLLMAAISIKNNTNNVLYMSLTGSISYILANFKKGILLKKEKYPPLHW